MVTINIRNKRNQKVSACEILFDRHLSFLVALRGFHRLCIPSALRLGLTAQKGEDLEGTLPKDLRTYLMSQMV